MSARRILVGGGGPAGTFAAIAAKKHDPSAVVTLLTREECEPYEKPPLSKAVLLGHAAPEDAPIAGPLAVAGHHVALQTGADCVAIDRDARAVHASDGRSWSYDALVIAAGAVAREFSLLPAGVARVHYLRTALDARALKVALANARSLLVVGGGLIGLEVAASAALLGVGVTVLEVASRVLPRVCDEETSEAIQAAHLRRGVDTRVATTLTSAISGDHGRIVATTGAGDRLAADLVVVATGARPDTALAASAGLNVDDGVVVDAQCRTSDSTIFAAGDCVRFAGPDGPVRLENWGHAQDQGIVAGRNAAGASEVYAPVPSFWSEQYDLYIQGVGWPAGGCTRVRRPLDGNRVLTFDVKDNRILYAAGINAQRDIAMARRLIERRVIVDEAALADPGRRLSAMLKR